MFTFCTSVFQKSFLRNSTNFPLSFLDMKEKEAEALNTGAPMNTVLSPQGHRDTTICGVERLVIHPSVTSDTGRAPNFSNCEGRRARLTLI